MTLVIKVVRGLTMGLVHNRLVGNVWLTCEVQVLLRSALRDCNRVLNLNLNVPAGETFLLDDFSFPEAFLGVVGLSFDDFFLSSPFLEAGNITFKL
jgi:hypothetical protein